MRTRIIPQSEFEIGGTPDEHIAPFGLIELKQVKHDNHDQPQPQGISRKVCSIPSQ